MLLANACQLRGKYQFSHIHTTCTLAPGVLAQLTEAVHVSESRLPDPTPRRVGAQDYIHVLIMVGLWHTVPGPT